MRPARFAVAALLACLVGVAAPGAAAGAGTGDEGGGDERVVEVKIGDNFFKPKKLVIRPGTTVVWRNIGRNEHNVLPDKGKLFGIDEIDRDATYSFRFDKPGRYGYYCSFHGAPRSGQFGTIKVLKPKQQQSKRDR